MRLRERSRLIWSWLPEHPGRLLDAGCSRGSTTALYARRATSACGIDIGTQDVAAARVAHPDIDFWVAPCEAIPCPDNAFDTVVCADVLEHVANEAQALRELRRVLTPGGMLILTCPHAGWFDCLDPVNYPRRIAPWLWRRAPRLYQIIQSRTDDLAPEGHPGPLRQAEHRHYTVNDLAELLDNAGFGAIERVARTGGLPYALWQNVAYITSLLLRPTPRLQRTVLRVGASVGDLDHRMPWGRAAYNVAVRAR